jgi:hypothetical protein
MKWILIAIVLIILPYTYLTLRYRRPGPAFQPYEDMKNRANVARLLEAGFRRIAIPAQRPADGTRPRNGAAITTIAGGWPADLHSTLVETPMLPTEITNIAASSRANTLQPYEVQFTCSLPDDRKQLGGAELFIRGDNIVIAPTFEPVAGTLQTRMPQTDVLLTIPPGALAPGSYNVTLVAKRASSSWPVEVK